MNEEINLPVGATLQNGKYRIVGVLGQGGFGITYQAEHTLLRSQVAIKELFISGQKMYCTRKTGHTVAPNFADDRFETFKKNFLEEASTLSRFRGVTGIVQVMDIFDENDTVYFVMDYVAGPSLKDYVLRQPEQRLAEAQAIRLLLPLLDALEAVHAQKILHRDIKPGNILLEESTERLILIDFGISREYEEDITMTHTAFKTPGYAAPEQGARRARRGAFTDVYSLGGVLYFMLTGERPQTGDERRLEGFQSPRALGAAVSPGLDAVITKAMEFQPADRYASCAALRHALQTSQQDPEATVMDTAPPIIDEDKTEIDTAPSPPTPDPDRTELDEPEAPKQEEKKEEKKATPPPPPRPDPRPQPPAPDKKKLLPLLLVLLLLVGGVGTYFLLPSEEDAWAEAEAQNTPLAYENYLKDYPEGRFAEKADSSLDGIAWQEALSAGTMEAFKGYKSERSAGRFVAKADSAIENIKRLATLPQPIQDLEKGMVYVKGDTFTMGCTSEQSDCDNDEKPTHRLTVSSFRMSKYEVTNAQFCAFLNEEGNQTEGGQTWLGIDDSDCLIQKSGSRYVPKSSYADHPVIEVSWYGAQAYCKWLSKKTGKNYRLPTEAEWEFAARGGTKSRGYKYAGSNSIGSVAWYSGNAGGKTHPVGQKSPNELGLYDMSGNVWEWCQDWYGKDYYGSSRSRNPKGPSSGSSRVLRGGGWGSSAGFCRVAFRNGLTPANRVSDSGFRLAL